MHMSFGPMKPNAILFQFKGWLIKRDWHTSALVNSIFILTLDRGLLASGNCVWSYGLNPEVSNPSRLLRFNQRPCSNDCWAQGDVARVVILAGFVWSRRAYRYSEHRYNITILWQGGTIDEVERLQSSCTLGIVMNILRIGTLGCAKITPQALLYPAENSSSCRCCARD